MFKKSYADNACQKCGSILEPNANFCVDCGALVKRKKTTASAPNIRCCPNCSAKVKPGSVFCMSCGTSLRNSNNKPSPAKIQCCSRCGYKLEPSSAFCMKCGSPVLSETAKNRVQSHSIDPEATGLLNEGVGFMYGDDSAPTSLLNEEPNYMEGSEATSLLDEPPAFPRLLRTSTGEEITINKPVFKIGKERANVDYCVTGNKTVSRVHAEIVNKSGACFIYDNNSTNKTYLNGTEIPVQIEIKLRDGDIIKMSNEEFEFKL